jgi:chromate transporter
MLPERVPREEPRDRSALAVFLIFLRLGCLSFGGPVAHLGFFRAEFVERRRWLSDTAYAELVALAQTLPGPASSQVGFALGLLRARFAGAFAAWLGFTLPSALLMLCFAFGHGLFVGVWGQAVLHGLQLAAVAIVAQAVLAMQRSLAPDRVRMGIALAAMGIVFVGPATLGTLLAIGFAGMAGLCLPRSGTPAEPQAFTSWALSRRAGLPAAIGFFVLLAASFAMARGEASIGTVFAAFYRTGALVFGGGHVVLPLLNVATVARGWVGQTEFLAGYGAAQAMPGPLFAFAAYLGAAVRPSMHPVVFGLVALVGLFLPGMLLMAAALPFWDGLRKRPCVLPVLRGVNAGVVGVLMAALYRPLWTSTIHGVGDLWIAAVGFSLLVLWRCPPWLVVLGSALLACAIDR